MIITSALPSNHFSELSFIATAKPDMFKAFSFAYITCLDSNRNNLSISPDFMRVVQTKQIPFHQLGGGIIVTGPEYVSIATQTDLFQGFDEVWFSNHFFTTAHVNEYAQTDWDLLAKSGDSALLFWMYSSSVVLGVRDGTDLQFVTTSVEVVGELNSLRY